MYSDNPHIGIHQSIQRQPENFREKKNYPSSTSEGLTIYAKFSSQLLISSIKDHGFSFLRERIIDNHNHITFGSKLSHQLGWGTMHSRLWQVYKIIAKKAIWQAIKVCIYLKAFTIFFKTLRLLAIASSFVPG